MTTQGTQPPGRRELPCELVQDLLPMYVEGELHSRTRSMVRRHLEGCSVCRRVRDEGDVVEGLHALRTLLYEANFPELPDDSKLFVTVDETHPLGSFSITIDRVLFDHANTVVMFSIHDREGKQRQDPVFPSVRMTDDQGRSYRGGGGSPRVKYLDPVLDDAAEVTLTVALKEVGGDTGETSEASFTIPVRKAPSRMPAALNSLNHAREIGGYRFVLKGINAGYSRTMLHLQVEPTEGTNTHFSRGETVQDGGPSAAEPRYFAFSWTPGYSHDLELMLEEAPGSGRPVNLQPAKQQPLDAAPPPFRGRNHLVDSNPKTVRSLFLGEPVVAALTGQVSSFDDITWLNARGGGGSFSGWPLAPYRFHGTFTFRSDPIPSNASSLLFELSQIFLYRYYDRTFAVEVPEDAPPVLSPEVPEMYESAEAAGAVTVPIQKKFSYDGVYIVLEELEVWPGSYYLRYHVVTPAGRLITGDYDLIIGTLHRDEERFRRSFGRHHPGLFKSQRGMWFSRSHTEDEVAFIICAIGEHHGALSWEIDLA